MISLGSILPIFAGIFFAVYALLIGTFPYNLLFFALAVPLIVSGIRFVKPKPESWHESVSIQRALVIFSGLTGFIAAQHFFILQKQIALSIEVTGKFQSEVQVLAAFFATVLAIAMLAFLSRCRILESIWKRPYDSIPKEIRVRAGTWKVWSLAGLALWFFCFLIYGFQWMTFERQIAFRGSSLAFVANGSKLVANLVHQKNGKTQSFIYDLKTGQLNAQAHGEELISVDGRYLARVSLSGRLGLEDLQTKKMIRRLTDLPPVRSFAFSADSRLFAFTESSGAVLWDLQRQEKKALLPSIHEIKYLEFSPDSRRLVSAVAARGLWQIMVWNLSTQKIEIEFEYPYDGHSKPSLKFTPDGKVLAFSENDGFIDKFEVWDLDLKIKRISLKRFHNSASDNEPLIFSNDGKLLAVIDAGGEKNYHEVGIWVVGTGKRSHRIRLDDEPDKVRFSEDRRFIAIQAEGTLQVYNLVKMLSRKIKSAGPIQAFEFLPQSSNLIFSTNSYVALADSGSGEELWRIEDNESIEGIRLSLDGQFLAIRKAGNLVDVWDTKLRRNLKALKNLEGLFFFSFTPDGNYFTAGCYQSIYAWQLPDLQLQWKFKSGR